MHVRSAVFQLISKRIDNIIHKKSPPPKKQIRKYDLLYSGEGQTTTQERLQFHVIYDMTPLL